MSGSRYAKVILPLAVKGAFTYKIPRSIESYLSVGSRVLVPFGKKRLYTAVVADVDVTPPEDITTREILEVLDDEPLVLPVQLQFLEWMSSYYLCSEGEVLRAAIPSGLRPESESKVRINHMFEDDGSLDNHERLLFEVVKDQGEVNIGDLELTGIARNPLRILKQLVEKGAVEINEFVRTSISVKKVSYLQLAEEQQRESLLHATLDKLRSAPRQLAVMERFLDRTGAALPGSDPSEYKPVERNSLIEEKGDSSALASLVRKGILLKVNREELRRGGSTGTGGVRDPYQLTMEQETALGSIREQLKNHQTVLLQGVTSSGKTELYVHLIREQIEKGNQVLYMLPEIALTTQIIERMRSVFGDRVGIFHSRYSDSDRVHVYRNLMGLTDEKPYGLVIGVRSAIFLPFRRLGLVVIDEEHETTYKQHDPAPRYHARDAAQVLALFHDAKVLMGTATPSFESLYNARNGKFGYTSLSGRYGDVEKPEIVVANTREALRKKQMVSHFTPLLLDGIRETLDIGKQVILFQNRRGYASYIVCNECGEIPRCRRCDVSLTFHRESRKLECHYCGHREILPQACPSCSTTNMSMKGFGTEKLEDEIGLVFEGVRVGRMDTDAARSAKGFERVIREFDTGKLDILIGTQMISKGLDFDNVHLVGIVDADSMLHFPDFRAFERSFQLISQVSGRAGRRSSRGRVVIQTMDPSHPVITHILRDDFETLYLEQMEERQVFHYPPFTRMIRISFRHRIPSILDGATTLVAQHLKELFAHRVYGPQYPLVRKVHNYFIKQIIIKIEKEASYEKAKQMLLQVLQKTLDSEVYRSVRTSVDVDPY